MAKGLVKELETCNHGLLNCPRVHGWKDDEWIMVTIGRYVMIHLFTDNLRKETCLEEKWRNLEIWDLDDDYDE